MTFPMFINKKKQNEKQKETFSTFYVSEKKFLKNFLYSSYMRL